MRIIKFIFAVVFLVSSGFFVLPKAFDAVLLFVYQHSNEAIVRMHLRFISNDEFNEKLSIAINEDDIDLANQIYEIGIDQKVTFEPELLSLLEDENGSWASFSRNVKKAWNGAQTGEVTSGYGLAGSFISDLSGTSDFRELSKELDAYPDYDSFNVALSLLGVTGSALTVSSLFNAGGSAPVGVTLRLGASTIKGAKTAGRLSKKLQKVYASHIDNMINEPALAEMAEKFKNVELGKLNTKQVNELTELAKDTVNMKALNPLINSANDMRVIGTNGGFIGLSKTLTVADELNDLTRLSKLSKVTKGKFAGYLTLAPKIGKSVFKSLKILAQAIVFILSGVFWLVSVIWYLMKVLKMLFSKPSCTIEQHN